MNVREMDQATQVSLPIVPRNPQRRIRRHNTLADLNTTVRIQQLRRPISLNVTNETKSRILYDSPSRIGFAPSTVSELALEKAAMRDRTPPFAPHNTINNNYKIPSKNKPQHFNDFDCSSASLTSLRGCCRCCDIENGGNWKTRAARETTPEGLSWRRLHMSRAKLKATATTSELLSGFAMVAMVELQINEPTSVPEWLFVVFAVCTTVLVAVHIFALMISTYILPNIDAIAKLEVCEMVAESPHERMRGFIELAWAFSTVLGLFLFLVEVAILCWVKFWDYSFTAAVAATVIVIPVLIIFILFAVHFYHSLVVHRCDTSMHDMEKLEDMRKHLEEVSTSSA